MKQEHFCLLQHYVQLALPTFQPNQLKSTSVKFQGWYTWRGILLGEYEEILGRVLLGQAMLTPRAEWATKTSQPGPQKCCHWTGLEFLPQDIKSNFTNLFCNFTSHSNPKAAIPPHFGPADKIHSLDALPHISVSFLMSILYLDNLRPSESWKWGHEEGALNHQEKHCKGRLSAHGRAPRWLTCHPKKSYQQMFIAYYVQMLVGYK